jgi:hypothetical protein
MLDEMSEAQPLMLQAAVEREDRILRAPAHARRAAARAFISKLIEAGWAKEGNAPRCAPVLRRDSASSEGHALKLTPRCLKANGTGAT